jgi:cobalt/nickel transport system permease protein
MHIPDGMLPPTVSITGYALTGGITWFSLQKIKKESNPQQEIPKASLLTSAFFVASLIHIPLPVPPYSIHFILNGLMGIILGFYAFPAILIGLFFQAVFFNHGGLSTLGINAIIMGLPALLAHQIWSLRYFKLLDKPLAITIVTFLAGSGSLFLSAVIYVLITINSISPDLDIKAEQIATVGQLTGYAVQAIIEGILTIMLVSFLETVKPEILNSE